MMFQDKAPLLHTRTDPRARTTTCGVQLGLLKAMGASLAGRLTYAAASRLNGIGRCAIGDIVSSTLTSCTGYRSACEGNVSLDSIMAVA